MRALQGVDLEVHRGECFGLLGPNGAGKSTLIKILTTLLLPTSGRALVVGYDVATEPFQVRKRINLVSGGDSSGYGVLTVRETLHLFSQFYGVPGPVARRREEELMEITGLRDKADARLSGLSTGMKQKLNFARGFMSDPEVIFLDEPTLGLDVEASRDARAFIARWVRERPERTVLLTTHYMMEADELCGRVAIIDHGRILALDTPSALKRTLPEEAAFEFQVSATGQDLEPLLEITGVRSISHHAQPGTEDPRHELRGNDVGDVTVADDGAIREQDDARRERGGEIQIVEDGDDGDAARSRERRDPLKGRALVRRIEMRGRLVEEQHAGLLRQGHREHGTLTLAARHAVDAALGEIRRADVVQRVCDGARVVGAERAERAEPRGPPQRDDLADGEREERLEDLRHDRDVTRDRATIQRGRIDAVDRHAARGRSQQAAEHAQQR